MESIKVDRILVAVLVGGVQGGEGSEEEQKKVEGGEKEKKEAS